MSILNFQCAVQPLLKNKAAMPEEATGTAISPLDFACQQCFINKSFSVVHEGHAK
jgi:hypothetical protein